MSQFEITRRTNYRISSCDQRRGRVLSALRCRLIPSAKFVHLPTISESSCSFLLADSMRARSRLGCGSSLSLYPLLVSGITKITSPNNPEEPLVQ